MRRRAAWLAGIVALGIWGPCAHALSRPVPRGALSSLREVAKLRKEIEAAVQAIAGADAKAARVHAQAALGLWQGLPEGLKEKIIQRAPAAAEQMGILPEVAAEEARKIAEALLAAKGNNADARASLEQQLAGLRKQANYGDAEDLFGDSPLAKALTQALARAKEKQGADGK